jgi:hypothetical protein
MFSNKKDKAMDLAETIIKVLESQIDRLRRDNAELLDRLMAQNFRDFALSRAERMEHGDVTNAAFRTPSGDEDLVGSVVEWNKDDNE